MDNVNNFNRRQLLKSEQTTYIFKFIHLILLDQPLRDFRTLGFHHIKYNRIWNT